MKHSLGTLIRIPYGDRNQKSPGDVAITSAEGNSPPMLCRFTCVPRRGPGEFCEAASWCQSGYCNGFSRCIQCFDDTHCAKFPGTFCDLLFNCVAKLPYGSPCVQNSACASNRCPAFFCADCSDDSHCSPGQFCTDDIPRKCLAKLEYRAICLKDSACLSNRCRMFLPYPNRCADCDVDSHCPSRQFCTDDIPRKCRPKMSNGALCLKDSACISGNCPSGQCSVCASDGQCPQGQFCTNELRPYCLAKLPYNSWCLKDSACASGRCPAAKCADCDVDSNCPSGQFCTDDVPRKCLGKLPSGSWCLKNSACISGSCFWLKCW